MLRPGEQPAASRRATVALACACLAAAVLPVTADALTLPAGFEQTTAIAGLTSPTDVEVAPGGRVFVAEKSGLIRTYESLSDPTPHTFADLRTNVHNHSSRGLLSLALDRPLTANFDATASSDPDAGDVIVYEWDLDGDGELDESTDPQPTFTYLQGGTFTVTLRVTDTSGGSDTDTITIAVGGAPVGTIESPSSTTTWGAGQSISFSGGGVDSQGGTLPPSALDWSVVLRHSPAATATSTRSVTSRMSRRARSRRRTTRSPERSTCV